MKDTLTKDEIKKLNIFVGIKVVNPEITRFIDEKQVVEFTSQEDNLVGKRNYEFYINHDKNWRIWFSQLTAIFISDKSRKFCLSQLQMKNGESFFIKDLSLDAFWNKVKERKFEVKIDNECYYRINQKHAEIKSYLDREDYDGLVNHVHDCLERKEYPKIEHVSEKGRCYFLIEV